MEKITAFYNANKILVWVAVGMVVVLATGLGKKLLNMFK